MRMGSVSTAVLVCVCLQLSIFASQAADSAALVCFHAAGQRAGSGSETDFIQVDQEGRYLYRKPVQFRERTSDDVLGRMRSQDNDTVSFSTTFLLVFEESLYRRSDFIGPLRSAGSSEIGLEGAAFIIAPDAHTVGAGGGNLGLAGPSRSMSRTFAVELDIWRNPEFGDPDGVHIGIDVGNMTSLSVAPVGEDVFNRTEPWNWVQVWIEYHNPTRSLEVRITRPDDIDLYHGSTRPVEPSLVREIDLSEFLLDDMYVGFSAAVRSCHEDQIDSTGHFCYREVGVAGWRFETFDKHSMASPLTGLYIEALPAGTTFPAVARALVLAQLAFLAGLGLFFYFRWDERGRWRFHVDAHIDAGPHHFSYHY